MQTLWVIVSNYVSGIDEIARSLARMQQAAATTAEPALCIPTPEGLEISRVAKKARSIDQICMR